MLDTTQDMYMATLDGIKKSYTGTIIPPVWNRLINEWGQSEWLRRNVSEEQGIELTQKQIDDLERLRVVTDGAFHPVITPDVPAGDIFTYPKYVQLINGITYPSYHRLLNVSFKITYVNNECDLTGVSPWLSARIMRSDQKVISENSPYRKPKDNRLYYELIDGKIRLITGTSSTAHSMRLEYIRKPRRIFFDQAFVNDAPNPNYLPNTGSVNCELADDQKKEIVEIAVRQFLERVGDPRYQSFMNEEVIRSVSQK